MNGQATTEKGQLILAAARRRFAHYGFSKVTMDEIAGDVGLAKPSLYYYYPTKESLFRAVIVDEQGRFFGDIQALLTRDCTAAEMLRGYVSVRLTLFRELMNLNALNFKSWAEIRSISGDLFSSFQEKELAALEGILSRGHSAREFSCPDTHQTATLLLHLLHGLRLRIFQGESGGPVAEDAYVELRRESELLVDLVVHAFRNRQT
jgi:TetR/AcrR family transcriptional repressor of mexJK operon